MNTARPTATGIPDGQRARRADPAGCPTATPGFPMNFRSLLLLPLSAAAIRAQTSPSAGVTHLDPVVVTGQLDESREAIVPSLGATSFIMDAEQILNLPQGEDAPFSQVLLRAPGVAEDSAANGDLHVRGEHANLQYRINNVLLPEGITGFGLELDPRFVSSMQLITGSLPTQYGFRTAGVVDIRTKAGAVDQGGEVSLYGGSYGTVRPSFEAGGSQGNLSYFADASLDHNAIGIENPTASASPIHDNSDQYRAFTYLSYILDSSSRLSLMASASYSDFQVPDAPGLPAGTSPDGSSWLPGTFDSSKLDENQNEQNYYGVAAYQKSSGDLNFQLSAYGRESSVHFRPDPAGDLHFNGVSSDVERRLRSVGIQGAASYGLSAAQALRAGFAFLDESVSADSATTVFPVDASGDPTGTAFAIGNDGALRGLFAGKD